MKEFEIEPKVGVGPIRLGMTREEVREQLGDPDDATDQREWYLEDMAIDFDKSGHAEFIELAASERFRVIFQGKDLHELEADDAVAHLRAIAEYDENDPELGCSFVFPALQLCLWRPMIPFDGQDEDDPTGRRFEAIGVAGEGYFG